MRRREFIAFVGCTAAAWSLAARAEQQSSMPVIGFLNSTSLQPFANYVSGFRVGLKQTGYIDGQNVTSFAGPKVITTACPKWQPI